MVSGSSGNYSQNYVQNTVVNVFPILAYQKIYQDFFRWSQWEKSNPSSYNVDYFDGVSPLLISDLPAADINITVIDKGRSLSKRKCPMRDGKPCANCEPCNIMCGFGGAGTFSDCKLSLTPCNDVGGDIVPYLGKEVAKTTINAVEAIFDKFDEDRNKRIVVGKEKNEKYKQIETTLNNEGLELNYCPTKHLGTDGTYKVMESMYSYLVNKGVQFIFNHAVKSVELTNKMTKIVVLDNDEAYMTDYLILAPGRSGNT